MIHKQFSETLSESMSCAKIITLSHRPFPTKSVNKALHVGKQLFHKKFASRLCTCYFDGHMHVEKFSRILYKEGFKKRN